MRAKASRAPTQHSWETAPAGQLGRPRPVQAKSRAGLSLEKSTSYQEKQAHQASRTGRGFGDIPLFSANKSDSLPALLRQKMETAFHTDFSDVRVHTEVPQAQSLSALAFTQGRDIHFAPGQYKPGSQEGQRIIAHELTHVMQQRAGRVTGGQGASGLVNTDSDLEAEAGRIGARAVSEGTVGELPESTGRNQESGTHEAMPVQRTTAVMEGGGTGGDGGGKQPLLCPLCGGNHTVNHCPAIPTPASPYTKPKAKTLRRTKERGLQLGDKHRAASSRGNSGTSKSTTNVESRLTRHMNAALRGEPSKARIVGQSGQNLAWEVDRATTAKQSDKGPRQVLSHTGGGEETDPLDFFEAGSGYMSDTDDESDWEP